MWKNSFKRGETPVFFLTLNFIEHFIYPVPKRQGVGSRSFVGEAFFGGPWSCGLWTTVVELFPLQDAHFHGSLVMSPTTGYMVYNGYYKVMSNSPKMGHLPIPDFHGLLVDFFTHMFQFELKAAEKLWTCLWSVSSGRGAAISHCIPPSLHDFAGLNAASWNQKFDSIKHKFWCLNFRLICLLTWKNPNRLCFSVPHDIAVETTVKTTNPIPIPIFSREIPHEISHYIPFPHRTVWFYSTYIHILDEVQATVAHDAHGFLDTSTL